MSSPIKTYLKNLIHTNLNEYGVVVWYDPDRYYTDFTKSGEIKNTRVILYEGSYFKVRAEVDKFFREDKKPKFIIYINEKRDNHNQPLIEYEKAGCVLQPGGSIEQNTAPVIVVREALNNLVPAEFLQHITSKVDDGAISLNEAEKLASEVAEHKSGTLSLIFGTDNSNDILLSFLTSSRFDENIVEKKSQRELVDLMTLICGIPFAPEKKFDELREAVAEVMLLAEYTDHLPSEAASKYATLSLPANKAIRNSLRGFLDNWRQRADSSDSYREYAERVEKKYKIHEDNLGLNKLLEIETFPVIEELIMRELVNSDITSEAATLLDIIERRRGMFWARQIPEQGLLWSLLENALKMIARINESENEIETIEPSLGSIIEKYIGTDDEKGWYVIDRYYRIMESMYYELDIDSRIIDKFELLLNKCRAAYSRLIEKQINLVLDSITERNELQNGAFLRQSHIFGKYVEPLISSNSKCAYFLVDALRYEMAHELIQTIKEYEEMDIDAALASIPTTTEFGMASLLLQRKDTLRLAPTSGGMRLMVGERRVDDRSNRLKYFEEQYPGRTTFLKLDEIIKPKKSVQKKIKETDILVITSQEIDMINEAGNENIVKQLMDRMLQTIKRGIYSLASVGVEQFVISADHGFFIGTEIGKDQKIEFPSGEKYFAKKRCWIGRGGDNPENTVRFKATHFGYEEDMDFLFPRGTSIFSVPGGENQYFHGGLSLQETVIPVISLKMKVKSKRPESEVEIFNIELPKHVITNRIFTLKLHYSSPVSLFEQEDVIKKTLRLNILQGKDSAGNAEAAEYGFNYSTNEIEMEINKPNVVTVVLDENVKAGNIDLVLIDTITDLEVHKVKNIPLKLTI